MFIISLLILCLVLLFTPALLDMFLYYWETKETKKYEDNNGYNYMQIFRKEICL